MRKTHCHSCNSLQSLTPHHREVKRGVEKFTLCGSCGDEQVLAVVSLESYRLTKKQLRRAQLIAKANRFRKR